MKKLGILLALLVAVCAISFAQDAEREAIINVIEDEHQAFCDRDYEKLASYFLHSENTFHGNGILNTVAGWNTMSQKYQEHFTKYPEKRATQKNSNYEISIAGDRAFATFDQMDSKNETIQSKALVILRKVEEEWKIGAMTYLGKGKHEWQ